MRLPICNFSCSIQHIFDAILLLRCSKWLPGSRLAVEKCSIAISAHSCATKLRIREQEGAMNYHEIPTENLSQVRDSVPRNEVSWRKETESITESLQERRCQCFLSFHPCAPLTVHRCRSNLPCCASPACCLQSRNCPTVFHKGARSSLE